jgi:hypothetical protein
VRDGSYSKKIALLLCTGQKHTKEVICEVGSEGVVGPTWGSITKAKLANNPSVANAQTLLGTPGKSGKNKIKGYSGEACRLRSVSHLWKG